MLFPDEGNAPLKRLAHREALRVWPRERARAGRRNNWRILRNNWRILTSVDIAAILLSEPAAVPLPWFESQSPPAHRSRRARTARRAAAIAALCMTAAALSARAVSAQNVEAPTGVARVVPPS